MLRTSQSGIALLLWAAISFGQTPSALEPFISSAPLIQRPQVFEEMQSSLLKEFEGAEPGARLEYVTERLQSVQGLIDQLFTAPQIVINDKQCTLLYDVAFAKIHINESFAVPIATNEAIDLAKLKDTIHSKIDTVLKSKSIEIKDKLVDATGKNSRGEALFTLLLKYMKRAGFKVADTGKGDVDALAEALRKSLVDELMRWIDDGLTELTAKLPPTIKVKEVEQKANYYLSEGTAKAKKLVQDAFVRAQGELQRVVDDVNNWLVEANASLAVVKADGSLSSGVMLSWVKRPVDPIRESHQKKIERELDEDYAKVVRAVFNDSVKRSHAIAQGDLTELKKLDNAAEKRQKKWNHAQRLLTEPRTQTLRSSSLGLFVGHLLAIQDAGESSERDSVPSDTTYKTEERQIDKSTSLVGIVLRTEIRPNLEVSGQGAKLIGFEQEHVWEFGAAITYAYRKVRIGTGYFIQRDLGPNGNATQSNTGIWLSRATARSPVLYAGVVAEGDRYKNNELRPVVKVNFPFFSTK